MKVLVAIALRERQEVVELELPEGPASPTAGRTEEVDLVADEATRLL